METGSLQYQFPFTSMIMGGKGKPSVSLCFSMKYFTHENHQRSRNAVLAVEPASCWTICSGILMTLGRDMPRRSVARVEFGGFCCSIGIIKSDIVFVWTRTRKQTYKVYIISILCLSIIHTCRSHIIYQNISYEKQLDSPYKMYDDVSSNDI